MELTPPGLDSSWLLMESTPREFYGIVEALEGNDWEGAFDITRRNVDKLVHVEDKRAGSSVYVEERLQYKYRRFERKGLTLLHYAAMYDQANMVELLLKHKADPLKKEKGRAENNPFIYACIFGGRETIEKFLVYEKCAELVNTGNVFSWKPLYYIAERKEVKSTKLLLNKGAVPNNSVLKFSIKYSSADCVAELLKFSTDDVNTRDAIYGQTALHIACEDDSLKIVELLWDKKADATLKDLKDRTALQVAICNGAEKCAEFLIEKLNLTVKNGLQYLREAIDKPQIVLNILSRHIRERGFHSINLHDEREEDRDVLHKIVKSEAYSDEEFTEAVTKLGKNCIEYEDKDGRTPIMIATMLNKHKRLAILLDLYTKILTECLFTPDKPYHSKLYEDLIGKRDRNGYSAVHLATICDGPDVDFEQTIKVLNSLRKNKKIDKYKKKSPLLVLTESDGKTGMHLAIELKKAERALVLLKETGGDGVQMKDSTKKHNVIHCAIYCKIRPVLFRQLLDLSRKSEHIRRALKDKNLDNETSLHMALKLKLSTHVEHLLNMNQDLPHAQDSLHLRTLRRAVTQDFCSLSDEIDGDVKVVDPNETDEDGKNALHIAIENGSPQDVIKKLLQNGSNPVMTDKSERIPVHVNEKTDLRHLKYVLDHSSVKERGLTIQSEYGKILLQDAIKSKRPDVIKFLLTLGARVDSSILSEVIVESENEDYARLIVRFTRDTKNLMKQLRKRNDKNSESDSESDILYHTLIKKMPGVAEEAIYRSVLCKGKIDYTNSKILLLNEIETIEPEQESNMYNMTVLDSGTAEGNALDSGTAENNAIEGDIWTTLDCMVEHKELRLLQHPGVKHILNKKWETFGLPLYFLQLLAYCLLVIPLSILVLLPLIFKEAGRDFKIAACVLAGIIIFVSTLHLLVIISLLSKQCCSKPCKDFLKIFYPIIKEFHNYLQVMVYVLGLIFSILTILNYAIYIDCCEAGTWHVGLFAIILGWTYLIHLSSKLPFIGEHAIVFFDIVWTFLKLTVFALLLVLATTIVLAMTFFNAQALRSPFFTFRRGIVTVITMITGELDYSDVFGLSYEANNETIVDDSVITYPGTANFVWVIFLVIIPILLSNMLTGLAVGDVIEIQKNAALRKLEHQVKLVDSAEYYFHVREGGKVRKCFSSTLSCVYAAHEFIKRIVFDDDSGKEEKNMMENILTYSKKREAEIKEIKESGDFHNDTSIAESIEDVKEVAISCEKRIKEFKDAYDGTVKKLRNDIEKLKKELLSTQAVKIDASFS